MGRVSPATASRPAAATGPIGRLRARWASDSLVRNSGYQMATQASNGLLGYAFWILAARLSGTDAVGFATALLSVMTLVAFAANLGLSWSLMHNLPGLRGRDEWSVTVTTGLSAAGGAGILVAAAVLVVLPRASARFGALGHEPWLALLFVLGGSLSTVVSVADAVFSADRSSHQMLIRNLGWNIAKMALVCAPLAIGARLTGTGIVGSWVLALLASACGVLLVQLRRIGHRYGDLRRGAGAALGRLRSSLGAQYVSQLAAAIPQFALPAIVVARLGSTQNAYFYVTWSLGAACFLISPSVAVALFAEGMHRPGETAPALKRSVAIIAGLLLPVMVLLAVGGRDVVGLFGPGYADHTGLLLRLLILSAVPDAVTNVYLVLLRLRGRVRAAATLNAGMALLAIGGAWVLLPPLGVSGAGWAWLGAQSAGAVGVLVAVTVARLRRPARSRGAHFPSAASPRREPQLVASAGR